MGERDKILGIDTSNYKTSIAVADINGSIISDVRKLLQVKQGERGLRQSNALFQHIENLPELIKEAVSGINKNEICAVSVSTRPRPVDGSYMPVFLAGSELAECIGSVLGVPVYKFSHQEGHIQAVTSFTEFSKKENFSAYHLSGGTCELLKVHRKPETGFEIEIAGGSKDISFGQVLDRAGVAMGMAFPSGSEMDKIACNTHNATSLLKGITVSGLYMNLSGIDTQVKRITDKDPGKVNEGLILELFIRISKALEKLTLNAASTIGTKDFVFAGGVSGSEFISNHLGQAFKKNGINALFGNPLFTQDNAIGTAQLGAERYRYETGKSNTIK